MSSQVPPSALTTSTRTPSTHPGRESVQGEIERTTWYDFAAVLLFLVGTFNVIDGLAAIRNTGYVTDHVLFSSLHAWGWFFLIWGVIQLVATFGVFRGATWAIIPAVITAFFNAMSHLAAARTYPVWSITIVVLDVVVIYGLIVHSGRSREAVS